MATLSSRNAPLCFLLLALAACPAPDGGGDAGPAPSTMDSSIVEEDGLSPPLLCPGAQGCASAEGQLRAGAAARSITPVVEPWEDLDEDGVRDPDEPFEDLDGDGEHTPVWMAGFSMGRAATGVHDDNWSRVVVLEKGALQIGLVSLDLVGYFYPDVIKIRQAAADAGLDLDHVLVASTHQHEGKDTMGLWGPDPSTTGYDEEYIEHIVAQTVDALSSAVDELQPARVRAAQTDAPDLVADSREPQVIDPTITGLQLLGEDDAPLAHVVIWGNHPESLGSDNTQITSDYPHYLRAHLEETWPGSVAVFFAGALGGLMNPLGRVTGCPDEEGNDTCPVGDFARAAYIGEGVAQLITDAWAEDAALEVSAADAELAVRRFPTLLPGTNRAFLLAFKLGLITRDGYLLEDGRRLSAERMRELPIEELIGALGIGTEVSSLRLGPVEVLTVPGELYPELWLERDEGGSYIEHPEGADYPEAPAETPLQTLMPAAPLRALINNAGDALGYIIPKPQFDYTAPFAYDPDGQYGEQNSLGEDAAPSLAEAVEALYDL